jgi:hypothetical protein
MHPGRQDNVRGRPVWSFGRELLCACHNAHSLLSLGVARFACDRRRRLLFRSSSTHVPPNNSAAAGKEARLADQPGAERRHTHSGGLRLKDQGRKMCRRPQTRPSLFSSFRSMHARGAPPLGPLLLAPSSAGPGRIYLGGSRGSTFEISDRSESRNESRPPERRN